MSKLPTTYENKSLAKISPLQLYLQEIAKYPLLEPEEEFDLAVEHFETADIKAAHRLITANLRLVVKIANDFQKVQANLLDLIQEGNYGLMQAVKKYNPYRGVKLSSYAAWWIRAYILKHLMDHKSQVKIATTAAQRKLFYNLQKETDRLLAEYDVADVKKIAENLSVSEKDVIEMQKRLSANDLSLDAPVSRLEGETQSTYGDLLADEGDSVEEVLANKQSKAIFEAHVGEFKEKLKGRDLEIFNDRIMSSTPLTLQELGARYGVSRERARQLESRILKKLKKFIEEKGTLEV